MVGGRAPGPWAIVSLHMRRVVPERGAIKGNRRQYGRRKGARFLGQRVTAHAQLYLSVAPSKATGASMVGGRAPEPWVSLALRR